MGKCTGCIGNEIERYRIIAILRSIPVEKTVHVARALYNGGIRILEITFDQKSAHRLEDMQSAIISVRDALGDKLSLGAGTVMSGKEVRAAQAAGASFILSPNVDREVIGEAVCLGMEAIPGALTPSEVVDAYRYGASAVKLFPAGIMGLPYCRALMAPVNYIPLLAVGGVNHRNLPEFIRAGFVGAGIGSNLTDRALIGEGRYGELEELANRYCSVASTVCTRKGSNGEYGGLHSHN